METQNELNEEARDLLLDIAGKLEAVRDEVVSVALWYRQPVRIVLTEEKFLNMFLDYSIELEPSEDGEGRWLNLKAEFPSATFTAHRYIPAGSAYVQTGGAV